MEKAMARLKNRAASGAFATWRGEVEQILEDRAAAAKAVGHFFQSAVRVAWRGWVAVVERRRENREFTTRALVLYAMNVQGKAFRRWREAAEELAEIREKLDVAVRRMSRRALAGAFGRWSEWLEDVLEMREKLAIALERMGKRAMHAAFDTWAQVSAVEAERRRILIAHVAKRMNKSLGVVFAEWRDHVEFELRMRHVLDKAVRLMGNRQRTAAWARWRERVDEGRAVKMAMRKFVYGAQAHAFARWREFYADVLTLRRIASAMAHADRQSLRRCVDKWVAFVDGELDLKEKYKTAALKFFGNVKQKCFAEWVKYTVTMLRVKQLMGNGLRRQAKRALRAWSEEATVAKALRTKSAFLQENSAAGVGRRAFRIWIATMRGVRHWRVRHSRWAFATWLESEQRRKEEAMREAKLALVVKRLMFGNIARVFAGWRLIPQRNKRFFRKQQALKRAVAAGDDTIKRKRKALVATAWRGWRYQMVDQEKMALVKKMLSKRLGAARGTFLARWWTYVEYRRAKLQKFASAKETHARMRRRAAFARWAEATRVAEAELDAKLAKAMEFAFGATLALTVGKWRAVVAESKKKKMAMQRIAALLTGFGLENLAVHVLSAWLELARERKKSAARALFADQHRRAKMLDAAFLSWKVQSQPLSEADYLKAIGGNADDIWDRDFDDRGDPTELHAQTLVRRTRAMFDGRNPDLDDEALEDLEAIRLATPNASASAAKGMLSRVRSRAASLASSPVSTARASAVDSDSDDDDARERRSRTPIGAGVGGRPSARPPASSAVVGAAFCGECGAKFATKKKFCSECGERL
jgi:protein SFI1